MSENGKSEVEAVVEANRVRLEKHLEHQDEKIDAVHGEVAEVKGKVTLIDTRVFKLEESQRIADAIENAKEEWEKTLDAQVVKREEAKGRREEAIYRKDQRRGRWFEVGTRVSYAVIGGSVVGIGHLIGWW